MQAAIPTALNRKGAQAAVDDVEDIGKGYEVPYNGSMQAPKPVTNSRALDLTPAPEDASAREAQERQREAWLEENREAIEVYNELVAQDGVFSKGFQGF